MWIQNKSQREWLNYNCGEGVFIDVLANATFEVEDERAGIQLLKILGCPAWLTKVEEPGIATALKAQRAAQAPTEAPKAPEEAPVAPETTPEPPETTSEPETPRVGGELNKPPFCDQCDSKGGPAKKHKKDCPTNEIKKPGEEVDSAGEQKESSKEPV